MEVVKEKVTEFPADAIREEAASLKLQAIISTDQWSMANINGFMIEEGGEIMGYTLLKVDEYTVELVKNGVTITLEMEKGK